MPIDKVPEKPIEKPVSSKQPPKAKPREIKKTNVKEAAKPLAMEVDLIQAPTSRKYTGEQLYSM
jgi:hypothetical protein